MSSHKNTKSFKMLLAIDGSRHSNAAAKFIQHFTFPPETSLYLLKVIDIPEQSSSKISHQALKTLKTQETQKAREFLNQQCQKLNKLPLAVSPLISQGIPGSAILTAIDRHSIELVVLGTHGRQGLNRFLLGSVSEWVLSEAPCSTLIVRPNGRTSKSKLKGLRVLLATDGSPDAQAAINFLNHIELPPQSRITLLHVVKKHFYQTEQLVTTTKQTAKEMDSAAEKLLKHRGREGAQLLHDTCTEFSKKGLPASEHLAFGSDADEILKCAKRIRADLIVLGCRGKTRMRKLLLGSVSNKVVRHAPCSVLVVRKPGTSKTSTRVQ